MEANIFSKKSSLVLYWLLTQGLQYRFSINGLSKTLSLSSQTVYKVIHQLVHEGIVISEGHGTATEYQLKNPEILLKKWTEGYDINKKCKVLTYRSPAWSHKEIEDRLFKAGLQSQVLWALHSATYAMGKAIIQPIPIELYVLNEILISQIEKVLQLEQDSESYSCVLIVPYYLQLAKMNLPQQQSQIQSTSAILTYMDLYHYKYRGLEAADSIKKNILSEKTNLYIQSEKHLFSVLREAYQALPGLKTKGVVVGGVALMLYASKESQSSMPVMTTDIDIYLSRKETGFKMAFQKLQNSGFEHKFKGLENPPPEAFEMVMDGQVYELEFVTDAKSRSRNNANVKVGSLTAQPLKYIELSQSNYITMIISGDLKIKVVSSGAWLFHKGLTFNLRRSQSSKFFKDLYGIWFLCTQLGKTSKDAYEELKCLKKRYPSWAFRFKRNLNKFILEASPSDWRFLQAQDPEGRLTKAQFCKIVGDMLETEIKNGWKGQ